MHKQEECGDASKSVAHREAHHTARRWPPLVTWVTGISAAAAGVRAVALARVLSR